MCLLVEEVSMPEETEVIVTFPNEMKEKREFSFAELCEQICRHNAYTQEDIKRLLSIGIWPDDAVQAIEKAVSAFRQCLC